MTSDAVRVLYVAGNGRSGTTLVASVLGQVPGLFSAGELRYVWERGVLEEGRCGCGAAFGSCPTWQRVLGTALAGPERPWEPGDGQWLRDVAAASVEADARVTRVRHILRLAAWARRPQRLERRIGPHGRRLGQLYGAIPTTTGCDVVVDSSKLPGHAVVLGGLPNIELVVVHLVRDPRGVAYSWRKHRPAPDRPAGGIMARATLLESAVLWTLWNAAIERLWGADPDHYLRVRYEDFVEDPAPVCAAVLRLLGRDDDLDAVVIDGRAVKLGATHSVAGNPDRLRQGRIELRPDTEWARRLSTAHVALVTAVTAPLLRRYGYPFTRNGVPGVRLADLPPLAHLLGRVRRNAGWIRDRGWAPFLEEHDVDPRRRITSALARRRWQQTSGRVAGQAAPILVVGLQRSGTNMVARVLAGHPEMEVHNENDHRAFRRYQLRPVPEVRALIAASPARYVVLKPLCDSHRTGELLDQLRIGPPGRAIWVYRDYEARARSSVAKFGDSNLAALRDLGRGGHARWQLQRLSRESRELVASFDLAAMNPASGAALLWFVRNSLYFELGLHQRGDVTLCSYDSLTADPPATLRPLCSFLGIGYHPHMAEGLARRPPPGRAPLQLDRRLRSECDALQARLDAAAEEKRAAFFR